MEVCKVFWQATTIGRNVWSEYLSLRSFLWVLAARKEFHVASNPSPWVGTGVWDIWLSWSWWPGQLPRARGVFVRGGTWEGPACVQGSTRLVQPLSTHSWPPNAGVAKAVSSFSWSAPGGWCRPLCCGGTMWGHLPLFRRKLKMKIMEFILELVATPWFIGLLYPLSHRRGILSAGIGLSSNLFSFDCHFWSICLVTSLMPFAGNIFSMPAEHGQNKVGLFGIPFVLLCFRALERLTKNYSSVEYAALCYCLYPSVELPVSSTMGILVSVKCLEKWTHLCFPVPLTSHLQPFEMDVYLQQRKLKFTNWCTNTLIYMQFGGVFSRNASICINKTSFLNISVNKSRFHGCQKMAE